PMEGRIGLRSWRATMTRLELLTWPSIRPTQTVSTQPCGTVSVNPTCGPTEVWVLAFTDPLTAERPGNVWRGGCRPARPRSAGSVSLLLPQTLNGSTSLSSRREDCSRDFTAPKM